MQGKCEAHTLPATSSSLLEPPRLRGAYLAESLRKASRALGRLHALHFNFDAIELCTSVQTGFDQEGTVPERQVLQHQIAPSHPLSKLQHHTSCFRFLSEAASSSHFVSFRDKMI